MNRKRTINRTLNSRLTVVEQKKKINNSYKKSKTRLNEISNKVLDQKTKYLNVYQSQGPQDKFQLDQTSVDQIFEKIARQIKSNDTGPKKKLHFDGKGSLTMISENKDIEATVNKSKADLISGSLINNYWPAESSFTKDCISKFEPKTLTEIPGHEKIESKFLLNEKLKKTTQRARELVGIKSLLIGS